MKHILCTSIACLVTPRVYGNPPTDPNLAPDLEAPAPNWDAFEEQAAAGAKTFEAPPPTPAPSSGGSEDDSAKKKLEEEEAAKKKAADQASTEKKEAEKAAFEKAEQDRKTKEEEERKKGSSSTPEADKSKTEKKGEDKPDQDKDIDEIQTDENAPQKVKKSMADLRKITKAERRRAEAAEAEIAKLKQTTSQPTKEVTEQLETLKKQNEDLRKRNLAIEGRDSEEFKAKYLEPVTKAQDRLRKFLEQRKMPAPLIDKAIAEGDNWARWSETKGHLNDGDQEELADLRREVRGASRAVREAEEDLKSNAPKFAEETAKATAEKTQQFWQDSAKHAATLMQGKEIGMKMQLPEGATEDQRKYVETHNKMVDDRSAHIADLTGRAIQHRDPQAAAELSFEAYRVAWMEPELQQTKADLKTANDRIAELEGIIAKARGTSDPGNKTVPITPVPKPKETAGNFDDRAGTTMDASYEAWKAGRK